MDYKYIHQLVERYFAAETTLAEEQILKTFFSQPADDIPAELRCYTDLFAALTPDATLGTDFEERMLDLTVRSEQPRTLTVKARRVGWSHRLAPIARAAAIVGVVLTVGNAMNSAIEHAVPPTDEINYARYSDTYDDPAVAFSTVEGALQLVSEAISEAQRADSLKLDSMVSNQQ